MEEIEAVEMELEKLKRKIVEPYRSKIIKEIILSIGRIKIRLKKTIPPLPIPDGKIVMEKELPRLKELLSKVV